jgi:hypothetical protein
MAVLKLKIPEELRMDLGDAELKRSLDEWIAFEVKRRRVLEFLDTVLADAKQVSEKECVELGNLIKKSRLEELKKMGIV